MNHLTLDLSNLEHVRDEGGGYSGVQHIYKCPACSDKTGHLAVDMGLGVGKCWKCGLVAPLKLDGLLTDSPGKSATLARTRDIPVPGGSVNLPMVPHHGPLSLGAHNYLVDRFRSEAAAKAAEHKYCIKETTQCSKGWDHRVLIPVFGRGQLETYVARTYRPDDTRKRVLNGPKSGKDGCMFLATPNSDSTMSLPKLAGCAIVEGVFDALQVGRLVPSIALLGSRLHPAQLRRLLEMSDQKTQFSILGDPDSAGNRLTFVSMTHLRAHGRLARPLTDRLLKLGKDPGACSLEELHEVLTEG